VSQRDWRIKALQNACGRPHRKPGEGALNENSGEEGKGGAALGSEPRPAQQRWGRAFLQCAKPINGGGGPG